MSIIAEVVSNDMCIGCGLCEAITRGRVPMQMTDNGSLRPLGIETLTKEEESVLSQACPGVVAEARREPDWPSDPIWGAHGTMVQAWAGDPGIRHRAATGGVLTALGVHLLKTEKAAFVLHVGADPSAPMRSRTVISDSVDSVMANTGSRYGPTSPLAGLVDALDHEQPFAIIAKPCDLGAVHRLARLDPRVDELCVARLAMVCGGQSRSKKSQALLDEFGIHEQELSLFRYRGHGNPGQTVIETVDGRRFEKTYLELWEDTSGWELETRCKLCPDALGEAADVSAADIWPGGAPTGEDEGFNGIIVRSNTGEDLIAAAQKSGDLVLGEPITPREFDHMQPHQVRKKEALAARYAGLVDAGVPPVEVHGLRLHALGDRLPPGQSAEERAGTARRIRTIREANASYKLRPDPSGGLP